MEVETIKVLMPLHRAVVVALLPGERLCDVIARIHDEQEFPIDRSYGIVIGPYDGLQADPECVLIAGDVLRVVVRPGGRRGDGLGDRGQWREAA